MEKGFWRLFTMKILSECAFGGLQILGVEAIAHMDALALLGDVGFNDSKLLKEYQVSPDSSVVGRQCPSDISGSYSTATNRQVAKNFRTQWRHAENRRHVGSSAWGHRCWVSIICHSVILPKNQERLAPLSHYLIQRVRSNDTLLIHYRQKSTSKERSGEL